MAASYFFGTEISSATAPSIPSRIPSLAFKTSLTPWKKHCNRLPSPLAFPFGTWPAAGIDRLDRAFFPVSHTSVGQILDSVSHPVRLDMLIHVDLMAFAFCFQLFMIAI